MLKLKARADLIEIVSEKVDLKSRGANLFGLCPFHGEKSPSFSVRSDGSGYHCFGCGVSGNVFSFVMETQGLSFPDAVDYLGQRYGVEIKRSGSDPKTSFNRSQLYELADAAQEFFRASLLVKQSPGLAYLAKRGITREAVEAYKLGYAPNDWDALVEFLKSKGLDLLQAQQLGLIGKNENGKAYSKYRGRLIFPIFKDTKRLIGFGGRLIPDLFSEQEQASNPKYINSAESPVYHKSRELFGYPQAQAAIRAAGFVYIVEGYLDVISLWQVGVKNVLATCGTALTVEHLAMLKHITKRITLLFDGDKAGRAGAV